MTDEEKIREFLAKKGATVVAEGKSALGYTGKEWAQVVRGNAPRPQQPARTGFTQSLHTDHKGQQWTTNEHGELVFLG